MKRVYICSPNNDVETAKHMVRLALYNGYVPVSPLLMYEPSIDSSIDKETKFSAKAALELLSSCEVVWAWDLMNISESMRGEINHARRMEKNVYDVCQLDDNNYLVTYQEKASKVRRGGALGVAQLSLTERKRSYIIYGN